MVPATTIAASSEIFPAPNIWMRPSRIPLSTITADARASEATSLILVAVRLPRNRTACCSTPDDETASCLLLGPRYYESRRLSHVYAIRSSPSEDGAIRSTRLLQPCGLKEATKVQYKESCGAHFPSLRKIFSPHLSPRSGSNFGHRMSEPSACCKIFLSYGMESY